MNIYKAFEWNTFILCNCFCFIQSLIGFKQKMRLFFRITVWICFKNNFSFAFVNERWELYVYILTNFKISFLILFLKNRKFCLISAFFKIDNCEMKEFSSINFSLKCSSNVWIFITKKFFKNCCTFIYNLNNFCNSKHQKQFAK